MVLDHIKKINKLFPSATFLIIRIFDELELPPLLAFTHLIRPRCPDEVAGLPCAS